MEGQRKTSDTFQNEEFKKSNNEINLNAQLKYLRYMGMWFIHSPNDPQWKIRFFPYYTMFVAFIVIGHLVTLSIAAYQHWGDLQEVAMILSMVLSYIEVSFKVVELVFFRDRVENLVATLLEDLSEREVIMGVEQTVIVEDTLKHIRKISKFYIGAGLTACSSWCLEPMLDKIHHMLTDDGSTEHVKALPFMAWYPFNTEHTPGYEIAFLFQAAAGFYGTFITTATDITFVSFMIYTSSHLKMLGKSLENIRRTALERHEVTKRTRSASGVFTSLQRMSAKWTTEKAFALQEEEPGMEELSVDIFSIQDDAYLTNTLWGTSPHKLDTNMCILLNQCIQHHQAILRFASDVESLISPMMLFQFLATTLEICLAGFQAKLGSVMKPSFMKFIMYTLANVLQTFVYCKYGDNIIVESTNFCNSIYNSEWYEGSERFKRTLRILLIRTHKPIKLWAGKFYTVSLETFSNLMHHSYSYFTLLTQLNE